MSIKLSTNDTRVLQALRAGPMDSSELYERFTGQYAMKTLLSNGYVQLEAGIYRITEIGRQVCPSRRQVERAKLLPPLPIQPARIVKPVETISIYTVPVIKERDSEMKPKPLSKSDFIRLIIKDHPGISHDELIAKYTNNSIDKAILDKASALIDYIIRQGGYGKLNDSNQVKRYYTSAEYRKQKENIEIQTFVGDLQQPQESENPVVNLRDLPSVEPMLKEFIEKAQTALEVQEGGDHYKRMKIQPVQYIMANNIGFIEGSVIKYVSRWRNKNGLQDLKKARHFLDILIEQQSAA